MSETRTLYLNQYEQLEIFKENDVVLLTFHKLGKPIVLIFSAEAFEAIAEFIAQELKDIKGNDKDKL